MEEKKSNDEKVADAPVEYTPAELIDKLKRLQAEFDNYRKRNAKEVAETIANANAGLITQMLSVLDNFELSLKYNKDRGVQMIHDELLKVLQRQGLEVVDVSGDFDANVHEAVGTVAGDDEGKIAEEVQKGYLLNNKLLRASKVKIIGN